MVLIGRHSSGGGDLPLLLKGKVLESLMEALVVGILFFHFVRFVVAALIAFIVLVIELGRVRNYQTTQGIAHIPGRI